MWLENTFTDRLWWISSSPRNKSVFYSAVISPSLLLQWMHIWVRKGNMTGKVKVSLVFFIPRGILILGWLWANWSTYRYLCEALKLATICENKFLYSCLKKKWLQSSLCNFTEGGYDSVFHPFPPVLSVPTDTCVPDPTVYVHHLALRYRSQLWDVPLTSCLCHKSCCAVAQQANSESWSCVLNAWCPELPFNPGGSENVLLQNSWGCPSLKCELWWVTLKKGLKAGIRTSHWHRADSPELRRAEPLWSFCLVSTERQMNFPVPWSTELP